jgi:hypothetical protein
MKSEDRKLIMKFMGVWDDANDCPDYHVVGNKGTPYNSSWDWLIPVVEKISAHCELDDNFTLYRKWLSEKHTDQDDFLIFRALSIEELYESVVDFLKFYNENKGKKLTFE